MEILVQDLKKGLYIFEKFCGAFLGKLCIVFNNILGNMKNLPFFTKITSYDYYINK